MRYSLNEYILYINLRLVAAIFQALPLRIALFIGRFLGMLSYWLDAKHVKVAYRNLRIAFSREYSIRQLKAILKKNYQNLGMSLVETLRLPKVNKDYVERYIKIKGREILEKVYNNRQGGIILGAHFGTWEVCFAAAGFLGYSFYVLAEEQAKNPLIDIFLNQVRKKHGVGVLKVNGQFHRIVSFLKEGNFVGMVVDHGIKEGVLVDFFNRKTRTPTGAVRIGLKFDVPLLVSYIRRIKGPEHELVISSPLVMRKTGNFKEDIITNLETINRATQNYIAEYPEQYLWFFKRFKYSTTRHVLILHDGKVGHLRQSQAVAKLIENIAQQRQLEVKTKLVKIRFKNKSAPILQSLSVSLAHRHTCRGCLLCLKALLEPENFRELQSYFADTVISCGSSIAAVNFVISSENQAKSIAIMRPGFLSIKRFDLVIMPAHDNPPKRDNIIQTSGALNLIDDEYIKSQVLRLRSHVRIKKHLVLGLLLGGDTKRFKLSLDLLKPLTSQIKLFLERYDGQILITTSRRSSPEVEDLIKQEFGNYNRCNLLVIANEKNIPEALGGILGLSNIVVVSPESISMISEAASSGRYVVVFSPQVNIGRRHNQFLEHFAEEKYIYLADSLQISKVLEEIVTRKPEIVKLQDSLRVKKALERIFK